MSLDLGMSGRQMVEFFTKNKALIRPEFAMNDL